MTPNRAGAREIGSRVVLVVLSVTVTLIFIEVVLRVWNRYFAAPDYGIAATVERYRPHPIWHHWLRPNTTTSRVSLNPQRYPAPLVYTTNAYGCRDSRDLTGAPRAGTRRIIVMGDSFTEGYYYETTFANLLEVTLNQRNTGTTYEVINCGTASYSPLLHYLRYRDQLRSLQPHELIVNIDLTDLFDDNRRYRAQTVFAQDGRPIRAGAHANRWQAVAGALKYRFHTARLLLGRPGKEVDMPISRNVFAYHRPGGMDATQWEHDVGYTLKLLQLLIDAAAQDGVRVIFTMYPYRMQFQAMPPEPLWTRSFEARVQELAQRNHVPFYSAYDDLKKLFDRRLPIYWSNDFHFTPEGQHMWGLSFAAYYVDSLLARN